METNKIESYLIRYMQQDITQQELYELQQWIQSSPENKKQFLEFKSGYQYIYTNPKLPDMEKSWQKLHRKINPVSDNRTLPLKKKFAKLWYAAAVILAFIAGLGITFLFQRQEYFSSETLHTYNEIYVEKGGKPVSLTLSDGSKVKLNVDTYFKYPAVFDKTKRDVYLDGEGYFEVNSDAFSPFIVNLQNQSVTALGTAFNVTGYKEDDFSITTLFCGKVSVESYNQQGERLSHILLEPDQEAIADNKTGMITIKTADLHIADAWTRGEYKFRDEPLNAIIKKLNQYYSMKIHIKTDSLRDIKYNGTLSTSHAVEEILKLINYDNKFRIEKTENEIFIY